MLFDIILLGSILRIRAYLSPIIEVNHEIQIDLANNSFIEINTGDELRLTCSDSTNEDVSFLLPNLLDNRGYFESDFKRRTYVEELGIGKLFHLREATESDTGLYTCHVASDLSLSSTIYVFVKGSGTFLPTMIEGLSVDEKGFEVPCKSSRYIRGEDVELYVNKKLWKTASKYYDPRVGFKLNSKNIEEKIINQLTFQCVYTGYPRDTSTFLIGLNKESNIDDLELLWEVESVWPYVGGKHSMQCVLKLIGQGKLENKHQYFLNVTCPRCADSTAVVHAIKSSYSDRLLHNLTISSLTREDSGEYTCNWYYEHELKKTITTTIDVSPKKGQIKVLDNTPQEVNVKGGDTINISAMIAAFPEDLPGFSAKWIRKFIKPPKDINETENLVTDNDHQITSEQLKGGKINEIITIKNAKIEMSGIYVLTIELLDTIRTLEWRVNVQNDFISARIDIMSPNNWVVFDQKYYQTGTKLHVNCIVTAIPLAKIFFMKKRIGNSSPWMDVDQAELTAINGTYESGYLWNTTIDDDFELKCTGERNGKTNSDEKRVRVSDSEPRVATNYTRAIGATSHENPKDIYEGDNVHLICTMPNDELWDVEWLFREHPLTDITNNVGSHSRNLIAHIRNVSGSNAGEYTCVMKKGDNEKRLKQTFAVVKTVKPYHTQSDPEKPKIITYGQPAEFECNMDGTPKPEFTWFKDGMPYKVGDALVRNQNLYIDRVAIEDKGEFECHATNRAGTTIYKFAAQVEGAPKRVSGPFIFLIFVLLIVLLACLLVTLILYFKQKKRAAEQDRALNVLYEQLMKTTEGPPPSGPKLPLDQRVYQLPYNRQYELERDNLEIGSRLGCGQFGQVWMGWLSKPRVSDSMAEKIRLPVAVKGPLVGTNVQHQKMLAEELKIMCAIGKHPNVLALIGAVTKNMKGGELYVVVEMCDNGNLKDYLLKHKTRFINEINVVSPPDDGYLRPNTSTRTQYASEQYPEWANEMESDRLLSDSTMLATSDLISFSMQVANGMDYLSSIPCIHRDLAARNVLITNKKICRIADFGMARNEHKNYYRVRKSKNIPIPFRWMSIEAIQEGVYTQESDVWSFGIVLFEIFTLGGLPYPTISNDDLLVRLLEGHRNNRPPNCHEDIYELMKRCWDANPNKRPNFTECLNFLKKNLRLASPQLLERVELDLGSECERQDKLSQWLTPEPDIRETINGFGQGLTSPKETERVYIKEFSR